MGTLYKKQDDFAHDLAVKWVGNDHYSVRKIIRSLKTKAQAAYISSYIMAWLITWDDQNKTMHANSFLNFLHPNRK